MKRLILNLGSSCFVRCVGCYNFFANTDALGNAVPESDVRRLLVGARSMGLQQVTFGGGDPLSRTDIPSLLAFAKTLHFTVKVDTVGTTFARPASTVFYGHSNLPRFDLASSAPHIDELGLPLDGSTNRVIQGFRTGRPHLFEEVVEAIGLAQLYGLRVVVNTVVHAGNRQDLAGLADTIAALSIPRWQLFQFMPIGPIGSRATHLRISDSDFAATVRDLESRRPDVRGVISPKSRASRADAYLIVDDAGTAWTPTDSDERRVIGSIRDHGYDVLDALRA